jgi:hypothetical protein
MSWFKCNWLCISNRNFRRKHLKLFCISLFICWRSINVDDVLITYNTSNGNEISDFFNSEYINGENKYILYNGDSVESFIYVERWKYNGAFHNEITYDNSLFENVTVSNEVITGALVNCFEDCGIYTYMSKLPGTSREFTMFFSVMVQFLQV